MGILIRNATIVSFEDASARPNLDVLIEGNRVKRIGQNLPVSDKAIDGSGCYLTPGLVSTHAHTAMTLFRGVAEDTNIDDWFNKHIWMYEKNLTPEDVYLGTLLGAAEMLLAGVTFVGDMYFHMDQAWKAYRDAGMRADLSWGVFGAGEGAEATYQQALQFSEEYKDKDSRISVSLGPHSPYLCSDQFLQDCVAKAEALGLKLHIHVSEEKNQVLRSLEQRHMTPIEVLDKTGILRKGTILAHAYHATDHDLQLIRESGAGVAHCPKTYMKFGDIRNFLVRALRAGVLCGLGTDGAASNSTMSIFEAARDAALLAKCAAGEAEVAPISQVLPLLSRGGKVLGVEGYGRIAEGALADLVLIEPSTPNMQPQNNVLANLLYSLSERNVDTVFVDGQVVVKGGHLVCIDLKELYPRVEAACKRLLTLSSGPPLQKY